jgi:hypothetical protein
MLPPGKKESVGFFNENQHYKLTGVSLLWL